jgi:hypothetical protein
MTRLLFSSAFSLRAFLWFLSVDPVDSSVLARSLGCNDVNDIVCYLWFIFGSMQIGIKRSQVHAGHGLICNYQPFVFHLLIFDLVHLAPGMKKTGGEDN